MLESSKYVLTFSKLFDKIQFEAFIDKKEAQKDF